MMERSQQRNAGSNSRDDEFNRGTRAHAPAAEPSLSVSISFFPQQARASSPKNKKSRSLTLGTTNRNETTWGVFAFFKNSFFIVLLCHHHGLGG